MSQTIEQQRAKYALEGITGLINEDKPENERLSKEEQKNFVSYASSLPAMIHTNGLGQAMAFCRSKGSSKGLQETDNKKRSYNALYKIVSDWLCQSPQIYDDHDDILEGITEKNMQDYQLAQIETLVLMSWIKKFAKAFLHNEDDEEEQSA